MIRQMPARAFCRLPARRVSSIAAQTLERRRSRRSAMFGDGMTQREWQSVANCLFHDLQVDIAGCVSHEEIRERIRQRVIGLQGMARVTQHAEVAELDF